MNKWSKAIQALLLLEEDKVPEGFLTTEQVARKLKKSLSWTRVLLSKMVEAKLAEKKLFRIKHKDKIRPVPHYRPLGN